MLPVIFSIGPFTLYTFVVVMCVAVFAGLFVIWKRGRELHFEENELFDVVFICLGWMFVAARVGYGLLHIADFGYQLGNWLNVIAKPGWFFPAGLFGAAIALIIECKKRKWDLFQVSDILVTGLALVHAFIGLATWLSGIGYGLSTSSFIGMQFVGTFDKRYPVQLLELLGFLTCFLYLWWVESVYRTFSWYRKNKSQAQTGYLTGVYLMWWGAVSVIVAILRTPELVLYGVRGDIVIPVVVGVVGGWILLMNRSGVTWNSVLDYFGLAKKK
jgi:phosphatidylglycerol:prolipoprotein diacylglycerol transferase